MAGGHRLGSLAKPSRPLRLISTEPQRSFEPAFNAAAVTQRILHLVPTLEPAGAQRQLVAVAAGAARAGHAVCVAALERLGDLERELACTGVAVELIGRYGRFDAIAFSRLARLVRSFRPDVLQSWRSAAHDWACAAAMWCGMRRIVLTQHRPEGPTRLTFARWAARWSGLEVKLVVQAQADAIRWRRQGWPDSKLVAIPGGVSAPAPLPLTGAQVRDQLGLPATARLIVGLGELRRTKRWKDAIWATDLLQVAGHDVHLLLFGDGPQYERLRRFAAQANVAHRVHFLGRRPDAPRWLPLCELLWAPGSEGGHPRGILEAMAAGVPVIAADAPQMRELIVPGESGFLIPEGDRAGLARYAHRLFEDEAARQRIGLAARQRALSQFSEEAMVARYIDLYSAFA